MDPARPPWPPTTTPASEERMVLDAAPDDADDPARNLSAAARAGGTLFLAGDEGACIERLVRTDDIWARHARLPLAAFLDLDGAEEADVEGLATDDGWLWVLGSHARTRPKIGGGDAIDQHGLAALNTRHARCLLARAPLADDGGAWRPVRRDGSRRAGQLRRTRHGNALARRMARDPLLKPFTRIAAKEGGVDLEGIAVAGSRVAIGMRGPVVRTLAVLLEVEVEAKRSGRLRLGGPLHKRLVDLDGLGIRDLALAGDDLLILAGPTTGLSGPCAIHRWRDWLGDPPQGGAIVRVHRPERIVDLPFGRGDDHPEGLLLLDHGDVAVIPDGPAAHRIDREARSIGCDRFSLPPR